MKRKMASLLEIARSQPSWVFLLLSAGAFEVSWRCFSLLVWTYTYFLRHPKNLLDYGSWGIITGPTDGIGKATAFEMARVGLNLVLVGRSADRLSHVAASIRKEVPSIKLLTVVFDLSCNIPEGISRLHEAIKGLDIGVLINNAAVCYRVPKCLHEVDDEMYQELVSVNMEALTGLTRMVLEGMMRKNKGAIVNLGSGSCHIPPSYPMFAVYAGTKGYVNNFSRSLRLEYRKCGIDIQCQVPSYVVTKMVPEQKRSSFNPTPEEYAAATLKVIGYGSTVLPYWRHSIQRYLAKLPPESLLDSRMLSAAIQRRKDYPFG